MSQVQKNVLFVIFILFGGINCFGYNWVSLDGDFEYSFNGWFRPEVYYGKNISLLNSNILSDKTIFARHTFDAKFDCTYGAKTYGAGVSEFFLTVRNRSIWGNPGSIASTTDAEIKVLDAVGRKHKHAIPRHIFWMRELWLWVDLSHFFNLTLAHKHSLIFGAFPFMLGRGIALGDAYATGSELLGFYNDAIVDQFAFGAKLSGSLLKDILSYDLYTAILQNKSSNLGDTAEKILGQEYGRLRNPGRGFGKINFLIAARMNWRVLNHEKWGKLFFEPYALYNHDPEQMVEFFADASSKLGTIGLACEYYSDRFEFGFDYALNLGYQAVKGWDRNQIKDQNLNGYVTLANSHVVDQNGNKILFTHDSQFQKIIDSSYQNETENKQEIGTVINATESTTLFNTKNRFRNPYKNKYDGWMFVADCGVWLYKKDLMWTLGVGVATGDDNPNKETRDTKYSGFIGLQEVYFGKRVRSAFLLGGAGKVKRPLSAPEDATQLSNPFAPTVSGFTNLVFAGTGLNWKPTNWKKSFSCNPNLLIYWQEKPTPKFDALANKQLPTKASTFLGVEANIFVDYYILKSLKVFFVSSIFFPGSHYRDIRGKPLNKEQSEYLDRLESTGVDVNRIPNIGDNIAFTLNTGLEFRF